MGDSLADIIEKTGNTISPLPGIVGGVPQLSTANFIPPGVMFPFGGTAAPSGYLICDGTAISRQTYAALFAAIGTTHGAGDGSTTFNLPDMQGRVAVGLAGATGHVDVKTAGNKDAVVIGSRRMTHMHSRNGGVTMTGANSSLSLTGSNSSLGNVSHSHTFGREVVALTPGATSYSIVGNMATHDVGTDATNPGLSGSNSSLGLGGSNSSIGVSDTLTVGVQSATPVDVIPHVVLPYIIKI